MLRCVLEAKWCKFFQFCCANLRSGSREWPGFKDFSISCKGEEGTSSWPWLRVAWNGRFSEFILSHFSISNPAAIQFSPQVFPVVARGYSPRTNTLFSEIKRLQGSPLGAKWHPNMSHV